MKREIEYPTDLVQQKPNLLKKAMDIRKVREFHEMIDKSSDQDDAFQSKVKKNKKIAKKNHNVERQTDPTPTRMLVVQPLSLQKPEKYSQKEEEKNSYQLNNQNEVMAGISQQFEQFFEQKHNNREEAKDSEHHEEIYLDWMWIEGKSIKKKKEYYCRGCTGYKTSRSGDMRRHLKICKKFIQLKNTPGPQHNLEGSLEDGEGNMMEEIGNNFNANNLIPLIDERIEEKISSFGQGMKKYLINPRLIAESIYNSIAAAVEQTIITNLAAVIEEKVEVDPNFIVRKGNLGREIVSLVGQIDLSRCIVSLEDEITKAHQRIQAQYKDKTARTYSNNETCLNLIRKFSEVDLRNLHRMYDILSSMTKFQRKEMVRYYRKLREKSPFIATLREMPIISDEKAKRIRQVPFSYVETANKIQEIYERDKQLAADMWILLTLGLRSTDILKLRFINEERELVKTIRLTEKKTGSTVERYIPRSLIELIWNSGAPYPMDKERLRKAVKICLATFKSCYGYKHKALTAIIVALSKSHKFLNFHRNSSTTFRYYLNKNDEELLDNSFPTGINFIWDEVVEKKIRERNLLYNTTDSENPQFERIQEDKMNCLTIDCREDDQDRLISASLDGVEPSRAILREVSDQHLGEVHYAQQQHDVDISQSQRYSSIEECLGSSMTASEFSRIETEIVSESRQSLAVKEELYVAQLNRQTQKAVIFARFEEDIVHPTSIIKTEQLGNSHEQILVTEVARQNKKEYRIAGATLRLRPFVPREAKEHMQSMNEQEIILKNRIPRCLNCHREGKVSLLMAEPSSVECKTCEWVDNFAKPMIDGQSRSRFYTDGLAYNKQLLAPVLKKRNNNLAVMMGEKYILRNQYSKNIPLNMKCNLMTLNDHKEVIETVKACMEKLPLFIKESTIPGAGMGMFATADIKQNTMISFYSGVVSNHYEVNANSNSIFNLGWYKTDGHWCLLLSDGNRGNCGSRFINANTRSHINLSAFQGIYQQEIMIILITNKDIEEGSELFLDYGDLYSFDRKLAEFEA